MNHLAVLARWPEPGKVKTRLSPALSPAAACDLHRAMLADALAVAAAAPADQRTLWWADAPPDRSAFAPPAGFEVRDQGAGDLGERLGRVFDALLAAPGDHAVVIGTDCPDLGARHITAAFEALTHNDLVMGPASDGGYYLIGLSRAAPKLFRGLAWGTGRVLDQTLMRSSGLSVARLERLEDLDTVEDLKRWSARSGRDDREAPATAAALAASGLG